MGHRTVWHAMGENSHPKTEGEVVDNSCLAAPSAAERVDMSAEWKRSKRPLAGVVVQLQDSESTSDLEESNACRGEM